MKKFLCFLLGIVAFVPSFASITVLDPVVTDSYIKFEGYNEQNNYRFILDTYEWADRGPQFQLTITPLNSKLPAAFTAGDLSDSNYWEALFRYYTAQMAGQQMEANDNIKRLYVTGVELYYGQFNDYENLKIVDISSGDSGGSYTIPTNCFANCVRIESLECRMSGPLTLGENVIPSAPNKLSIYTYYSDVAQTWWDYLFDNLIKAPLYLNGEPYDGNGGGGGGGETQINGDMDGNGLLEVNDVVILAGLVMGS